MMSKKYLKTRREQLCYNLGLSYEEYVSRTRLSDIVRKRQIVHYVLFEEFMDYIMIGNDSKKDRTLVMYSWKKVKELLSIGDEMTNRLLTEALSKNYIYEKEQTAMLV